jgi:hypothetical protein
MTWKGYVVLCALSYSFAAWLLHKLTKDNSKDKILNQVQRTRQAGW